MGKSRKTVIVDDDVWWGLKERALKAHMGLNEYLDFVLRRSGDPLRADLEDGLVGLERRVDGLRKGAFVEGWRDPRDTVIDSDGKTQNEVISEHLKNQTEDIPSKIITKGSSVEDIRKLDSKITAHRIETKKGPVRANAAMEGFFSPQPKAKWKGAK